MDLLLSGQGPAGPVLASALPALALLVGLVALVALIRHRWPPLDALHTHGNRWSPWLMRRLRCRSYAQNGQDLAALRWLGPAPGWFVELGASNGVTSSNTLLLESRHGWQGLCIEADPWFFDQLRRHRRCRCVQACVDADEREVRFTPAGATGGIVDADTDNARPQAHAGQITMRTRRLGDLLAQVQAPAVIDLLCLDVEGAESRILMGFPFDRWRFRLMMIERASPALHAHLFAQGYRWLARLGQDEVYAHRDEAFAPTDAAPPAADAAGPPPVGH